MDDAALERLKARLELLETQSNDHEARITALQKWINPQEWPELQPSSLSPQIDKLVAEGVGGAIGPEAINSMKLLVGMMASLDLDTATQIFEPVLRRYGVLPGESRIDQALRLLDEEFGAFILLPLMANGNIGAVGNWRMDEERKLRNNAERAVRELIADDDAAETRARNIG